MNLSLRPATQADADTILSINLRSIFELCNSAYDLDTLQRWVGTRTAEYFSKSIALGQIDIAESDGTALGFTDVVKGEILAVYILPGFERRGVGSFLLAAAIVKAQCDHPVTILASLNAVSFYERYGFLPVARTTHPRNGVELPLVRMTRPANP